MNAPYHQVLKRKTKYTLYAPYDVAKNTVVKRRCDVFVVDIEDVVMGFFSFFSFGQFFVSCRNQYFQVQPPPLLPLKPLSTPRFLDRNPYFLCLLGNQLVHLCFVE